MPVYEYACTECGQSLEVRQSFSDDPLTECPACSGRLRKVLSPVGVVFKGSGFYRTDSRSASSSTAPGSTPRKADDSGAATKDGGTGSGGSDTGSGSTSGAGAGAGAGTGSGSKAGSGDSSSGSKVAASS